MPEQQPLDRDVCYRALKTRDARFDGRFYTAVKSTGIYCRPVCPARTPKLENCLFLPSAGAAHQLGFRSCLRCRPELAPGVAGHRGSLNTVSRALSLIAQGALDDGGVDALAERLGVGARQLRRLFDQHVGATPVSVAQAHRILFAKALIHDTALSMSEIALAAGFGSVRRFNTLFQSTYDRPPSALRRARASDKAAPLVVRLPYSPPFAWPAMLGFLQARAIPGVESVEDACYRRTFRLDAAQGSVSVRKAPEAAQLLAEIRTSDIRALGAIVARLRNVFDLDCDSAAVDAQLARSPWLAERVRALPGVRVPGAWDGFELAVRAVLGQQITVRAATTFAGRLVATFGEALPNEHARPGAERLFPAPERLAAADLTAIGLTRARARTLNALAAALVQDPQLLQAGPSLEAAASRLCALPGIGPWTAHYIALRALREPDAFPAADLGLMRALETGAGRPTPAALTRIAEDWRPWRAYAALRLWTLTP